MLRPWRRCIICGILLLGLQAGAAQVNDIDFLRNPVLTSQEAIQAAVERYQRRLRELEYRQRQGTLTDREQDLKALIRLFLIFAGPGLGQGGVDPGRLECIHLSQSDDPAVVTLREHIQIPAPKGVVFVRTYPSKQVMPIDILAAFTRDNTRGVTILSRYVALVEQSAADPAEQRFYDRRQAAVLSHELVHAYINASLAEQNGRDLPVWFHEGCATYLSDSPGAGPETRLVETSTGYRYVTFEEKAPWDYRRYRLVFDYLEAQFGRPGLYDHIRRAVETGTVETLLTETQTETPLLLMEQAERWQRRRRMVMFSLGTAVVVVLLLLIWRKLPTERNNVEPVV